MNTKLYGISMVSRLRLFEIILRNFCRFSKGVVLKVSIVTVLKLSNQSIMSIVSSKKPRDEETASLAEPQSRASLES